MTSPSFNKQDQNKNKLETLRKRKKPTQKNKLMDRLNMTNYITK